MGISKTQEIREAVSDLEYRQKHKIMMPANCGGGGGGGGGRGVLKNEQTGKMGSGKKKKNIQKSSIARSCFAKINDGFVISIC